MVDPAAWRKISTPADWTGLIRCSQDDYFERELMRHTRSGRPLGGRQFLKSIEDKLGYPVELKPRGRPRKEM